MQQKKTFEQVSWIL